MTWGFLESKARSGFQVTRVSKVSQGYQVSVGNQVHRAEQEKEALTGPLAPQAPRVSLATWDLQETMDWKD